MSHIALNAYKVASGGILGYITRIAVSYTHLRAHETDSYLVCRLLLEKKDNPKCDIDTAFLTATLYISFRF